MQICTVEAIRNFEKGGGGGNADGDIVHNSPVRKFMLRVEVGMIHWFSGLCLFIY